jgi:cell division septum initiation protein DivIVA
MAPSAEDSFGEAETHFHLGLQRLREQSAEVEKLRTEVNAGSKRETTQLNELAQLRTEVADVKKSRDAANEALTKLMSQNSEEELNAKVDKAIEGRTPAIVERHLRNLISDKTPLKA